MIRSFEFPVSRPLCSNPQHNPDLEFLQQYDKYLLPHFREEVLALYQESLDRYAAAQSGREHYVRIRKLFGYLQKITGGDEVVGRLLAQFRQQYKQCRAMIEELAKVDGR